jgi:hypothetical protein
MHDHTSGAIAAPWPRSVTVQAGHTTADGLRRYRAFSFIAESDFTSAVLGEVVRGYLQRHPDSPLGAGLRMSPAGDLARQTDLLLEVDDAARQGDARGARI